MLKPECDLDEAWELEDLDTATERTVGLLHSHTVPQRENKAGGESQCLDILHKHLFAVQPFNQLNSLS